MEAYALIHSVIESRHIELRRVFENKDVASLTERETLVTDYAANIHFDRKEHDDLDSSNDPGYFVYRDVLRDRSIFISSKEVGLSFAFHEKNDVKALFHLIIKNSNHEHYQYMSRLTRQWWIDNMKYVALQMLDTEGNIVLFCKTGRSRSPMYLVAYLVIMYSMSVADAMGVVGKLLQDSRGMTIDRHSDLVPIVEHIYDGKIDYEC